MILLLLINIVTANNCIKIGELADNIIYACPIQILNQPLNETVNETLNKPLNETVNKPLNETVNKPLNESFNKPLNESFNKPLNESFNTFSPAPALEPSPAPAPALEPSPAPAPTPAPAPKTQPETPVLIDEVVFIDKNINTTQNTTQNNTQNNTQMNEIYLENYTGIIISSIGIGILIILIILFFIRRKGTKNKICDSPNDIEKQFVGNASSSTEETIAITHGTIEQSNRPLPRTYKMHNVLESKIPTAKPPTIPVKKTVKKTVRKPPRPPRTQAPRTQAPRTQAPLRTLPPLPKKPAPPDYPPTGFSNTIADMPEKTEGKIESKEEIYEDDFE